MKLFKAALSILSFSLGLVLLIAVTLLTYQLLPLAGNKDEYFGMIGRYLTLMLPIAILMATGLYHLIRLAKLP